jgi:hypothetical protein
MVSFAEIRWNSRPASSYWRNSGSGKQAAGGKNLALTENLTSNGLDVNASAKAMMKPHKEFFNPR